jgi:hypothetical protein
MDQLENVSELWLLILYEIPKSTGNQQIRLCGDMAALRAPELKSSRDDDVNNAPAEFNVALHGKSYHGKVINTGPK